MYVSYYMFYYNISKKQYNIVLYTSERGDSYGTFCEDMDDFDFACAAFIYKITDRYDLSWERKKNESFDDWRNRRIMYADDLFVEINKYFEMKEAYKPHLYRYAGILKNVDEAIPYKKGIHCYEKNFKNIEIIQLAETAK